MIIKSRTIYETGSLFGSWMLSFITPEGGDIDRIEDFEFVEFLLNRSNNPIYEYLKENYPKYEL